MCTDFVWCLFVLRQSVVVCGVAKQLVSVKRLRAATNWKYIFFRMYYFIEYIFSVKHIVCYTYRWIVSTNCLIHHVTSNYFDDGTISLVFTLYLRHFSRSLSFYTISHLNDGDVRLYLLGSTEVSFQIHTRANRMIVSWDSYDFSAFSLGCVWFQTKSEKTIKFFITCGWQIRSIHLHCSVRQRGSFSFWRSFDFQFKVENFTILPFNV